MTGRINGRNGRNLKRNKKMKVRTNEKEKFKRERKEQQEIVNDLSKKKNNAFYIFTLKILSIQNYLFVEYIVVKEKKKLFLSLYSY